MKELIAIKTDLDGVETARIYAVSVGGLGVMTNVTEPPGAAADPAAEPSVVLRVGTDEYAAFIAPPVIDPVKEVQP